MPDRTQINNPFRIHLWFLFAMAFALMLNSCSPTKYLKENQYILKKNEITVDDKRIDKSEVNNYSDQTPNRTIFGFPFYVALHNMVNPEREAKRDIRRAEKLKEKNLKRAVKGKKPKDNPFYLSRWWKNTVGNEPVIFQKNSVTSSKKSMKIYLNNLGFYESEITDSIEYFEKGHTVKVDYNITAGTPFIVKELRQNIEDKRIDSLIGNISRSGLEEDSLVLFNAYKLDEMRYYISKLLQDEGYYGFGPDQVVFFADTNQNTHETEIDLEVFRNSEAEDSVYRYAKFPVYRFNNISVTNYPYELYRMKFLKLKEEHLSEDSIVFRYYDKLSFRPFLLQRRVDLHKDSLYRQSDISRSLRGINGLGIFRAVNFKITPSKRMEGDSMVRYLDCDIQLTPAIKQSYTIDLEGYTSTGTIGTGLKFTYVHRNLFKRAIYFNLSLNGKFERFTSDLNSSDGSMNAFEYGFNTIVRFPQFFSPFRLHKFNNKYFPNTVISVNYTYKDRVEYIRQTSSPSFGYNWSTPKGIQHHLNPIDFYLTEFRDIQYDYLEYLIDKNLYDQYFDHVIPAGNYSLYFSNQKYNVSKDFFLVNLNFELAGNLITLGKQAFNAKKKGSGDLYIQVIEAYAYENIPEDERLEYIEQKRDSMNTYLPSYYTFAGLLYNQYLKTDIDLRYTWFLTNNISFTARTFNGIIIPYGNTDFSPIEKQYFIGGSNDLRAWWARSIGPGAYVLDEQTLQLKNYYQNGDIKMLSNFELRHNILWRLNGALFVDMGNIWNIYDNPSFPDGTFNFNTFYKQLAIGAGYGIRIDFSFFIIRFDLAYKLRDPSIPSSNKWVYSQGDRYYKKPILNFGIGYPF